MDVWFDSGMPSLLTVMRPRSLRPSTLSEADQHRLVPIIAAHLVAMHGRVPIAGFSRMVHVDEKGRKMSKSIGNTLVPQKLTSTLAPTWCGSGSPPPTTPMK